MKNINIQPFNDLGFTSLESMIYIFLVEHSPATGYKIAKGIGKPVANVYKAIESLHNKGAILIDDSTTRLCRAVAFEELLDNLKTRVETLSHEASTELRKLTSSQSDNKIYQLQSTEQVFARYRSLLSTCQRVVILDLFPLAVELLRESILEASKRGVKITLKVYEPVKMPGVKLEFGYDGKTTVQKWPGAWANGVFDGQEYLLAFLSKDGKEVFQAVWSNNHYLSWIYYGSIVEELKSSALELAINAKKPNSELKKILKHYNNMMTLESTGFKGSSDFFGDKKQKQQRS
jgi:sugar-specific transcriptional regulator TrmB